MWREGGQFSTEKYLTNKDLENINIPLAYVKGEPYLNIPEDLYLPPDALEVVFESFEGPLDLLLYLIKSQNLDILELPVAKITEQYVQYIDLMQDLELELAAEYMLMAATLTEIKSKLLLPGTPLVEIKFFRDIHKKYKNKINKKNYKIATYQIIRDSIDLMIKDDALYRLEIRKKFREMLNLGFSDVYRHFNETKEGYTFWDYMRGAWQKNNGMRIDHFLVSNSLIDQIKSININKDPRGREKPSDHTPIEIKLA